MFTSFFSRRYIQVGNTRLFQENDIDFAFLFRITVQPSVAATINIVSMSALVYVEVNGGETILLN